MLYHRGFKFEPCKELGVIQEDLSTPEKKKKKEKKRNYGKDGKIAGTESRRTGNVKSGKSGNAAVKVTSS